VRTVVPFDGVDPKTRLGAVLEPAERRAFARIACEDVLAAVRAAGGDPELLATADPRPDFDPGVPVTVDERSLSEAVNAVLAAAEGPVAVVMADLALATPAALGRLYDTAGDVVVAPGLAGGTNALVVRHPDFRVDYHGVSCRDHRRAARAVGATLAEVDSFRLATDVDEPADLVEVLLHAEGRAPAWLRERGFELRTTDGRVTVDRNRDRDRDEP
jgi:2-phospho-L-lactate guanylyltransferase